jgi:hypothetical protein
MKYLKPLYLFAITALLATQYGYALESIGEEHLRDFSGQSGVDVDVNFKGTVGRIYFKTGSNSLNFRNFSIDTDGTYDDAVIAGSDRAIKVVLDIAEVGIKSGLKAVITNINDLDLKFEQFNVNGDQGNGDIAASSLHSYGGLSLLNINDHGGETNLNVFARGKDGAEGLQIEMQLPKLLTLNISYTDYGSDNTNNNTTSADDFSFGGDLALNNFTVENSVDVIFGTNAAGEDIGGLHIGVITQTGDFTLSNMRAGNQLGTMGRMVVNGYRMTPESYLTIQGK